MFRLPFILHRIGFDDRKNPFLDQANHQCFRGEYGHGISQVLQLLDRLFVVDRQRVPSMDGSSDRGTFAKSQTLGRKLIKQI